MYNKIYQMFPLSFILALNRISEYEFSKKVGLSRLTLRALKSNLANPQINSWVQAAEGLEQELYLVSANQKTAPECSVQAVCYQVIRDGEETWKIHYMNFIDEFRRSLDARLILLPPPKELSLKMRALMASIVYSLCNEVFIDVPPWAKQLYVLPEPWFVSESEALKAMSILESPLEFRRNQIFVSKNFLSRA